MERTEIQKLTIELLKKEIEKNGPDSTFIEAPLKCNRTPRWTLAEALTAAERDECLPECDINPVSDFEAFIKYCDERGTDWRDYLV